jgi:DNA-directed RNA polymerase subunit E'/Rpb7
MKQLFIKSTIEHTISIEPKYINNTLDKTLLKQAKSIEGICIKNGFVKPNSVHIINRSLGDVQFNHFNGSITYYLKLSLELCNPIQGNIIEGQVLSINKMGILAGIPHEENSPLNILLARQHHNNNKDFDKINEKDIIKIKVLGKRYEYGDTQISIIGILNSDEDDSNTNDNNDNNISENSNE